MRKLAVLIPDEDIGGSIGGFYDFFDADVSQIGNIPCRCRINRNSNTKSGQFIGTEQMGDTSTDNGLGIRTKPFADLLSREVLEGINSS